MNTPTDCLKKTPLHAQHIKLGAKMLPFGHWSMPINYGSDLSEHERVRHAAGLFDVSHMCVCDIEGREAISFIRFLCCTDIERYAFKQAMYTCLLNENGGVIDDLLVYKRAPEAIRLVVNANCADKDLQWIRTQAQNFSVNISCPPKIAMLALQGPHAVQYIKTLFPKEETQLSHLPSFGFYDEQEIFISRTGYTGEDGFELIIPADMANILWEKAIELGVTPCGLGSRNILRLEAGMNLYGHDMDDSIRPQECGSTWIIDLKDPERDFIGKEGTQAQPRFKRMGVITKDRGMLRDNTVFTIEEEEALITSGTYSPVLNKGIGLCRVPTHITINTEGTLLSRGKEISLTIVKPPFVSNKKQK